MFVHWCAGMYGRSWQLETWFHTRTNDCYSQEKAMQRFELEKKNLLSKVLD